MTSWKSCLESLHSWFCHNELWLGSRNSETVLCGTSTVSRISLLWQYCWYSRNCDLCSTTDRYSWPTHWFLPIHSQHSLFICCHLPEGTQVITSGAQSRQRRTNFVEVERKRSGNGAVESGLEERRPRVAKYASTTEVSFAHSSNAWMYHLSINNHRRTTVVVNVALFSKRTASKIDFYIEHVACV